MGHRHIRSRKKCWLLSHLEDLLLQKVCANILLYLHLLRYEHLPGASPIQVL